MERRLSPATGIPPGLRGNAIVGTALVCLDVATDRWLREPQPASIDQLARFYLQALAAVRD
ncbi:hypothetical protein AB0J72_17170 [Dactylosporangium sp. NPDC049742]|uniref:hypothetical protein n=1 Tax=Dactylosporangium sp. NPDC049742 TaxID=3154737 RepID=UPI00344906FC